MKFSEWAAAYDGSIGFKTHLEKHIAHSAWCAAIESAIKTVDELSEDQKDEVGVTAYLSQLL